MFRHELAIFSFQRCHLGEGWKDKDDENFELLIFWREMSVATFFCCQGGLLLKMEQFSAQE